LWCSTAEVRLGGHGAEEEALSRLDAPAGIGYRRGSRAMGWS
jgi:hypothetical protein